jgi:hypothetical protein
MRLAGADDATKLLPKQASIGSTVVSHPREFKKGQADTFLFR